MNASSADKSFLLKSITFLANKIRLLCQKVNALPGKMPELIATASYAIAHLLMAIVHEPWYDEAVAWQIARSASIGEILFQIPHYEGHPPLWHLILLPFAKLGAPYELSLTIVSLIFAGAAVGLIIWKSPFPRILRLLIPFTYFFFYQYGVISRPYCVMMLAFVMLALNYHSRNAQPSNYVLSLSFLCLSSAYGIVIAGGLAIVWVWEIWGRQNILKFLKTSPRDRRIWWLAGLLALALLLIAEIMPRSETLAAAPLQDGALGNGLILRLVYMVLILPMDVSLTSVITRYGYLTGAKFSAASLGAVLPISILFWCGATLWGKSRKTVGILFVPYLLFAAFSSCVYICTHHYGIGLLFFIFWFWITTSAETSSAEKFRISSTDQAMVQNALVITCAFAVSMSLYWNFSACAYDIQYSYAVGRNEAAFIKEHGLDQYRIMSTWSVSYDEDGEITGSNTNELAHTDNIAPYFDHNIFFNFNDGLDNVNYSTHRIPTEEENESHYARWAEITPDVLIMQPVLELVYDPDVLNIDDYTLVYSKMQRRLWKNNPDDSCVDIYVRNELAEELGLTEVDRAFYFWSVG